MAVKEVPSCISHDNPFRSTFRDWSIAQDGMNQACNILVTWQRRGYDRHAKHGSSFEAYVNFGRLLQILAEENMNVLTDALKLWPGSIPKLGFLEKLLHPAADPPPALVTALKVSSLALY